MDEEKLKKILDVLKYSTEIASNSECYKPRIQYELIKEVDMGQWAIATEEKPILATYALSTCTGILAYDLEKNFAFLAHSDSMFSFLYAGGDPLGKPSISKHIQILVKEIEKGNEIYNLKFIIFPGEYPDKSNIDAINKSIKNIKSSKITIVSVEEKRPFINMEHGGSITFDSRNGSMTSYNPKDNPYHVYDDAIDKKCEIFGKIIK